MSRAACDFGYIMLQYDHPVQRKLRHNVSIDSYLLGPGVPKAALRREHATNI